LVNDCTNHVEDPVAIVGSDEEIIEKFREIRDQIEAKVKNWLRILETQA